MENFDTPDHERPARRFPLARRLLDSPRWPLIRPLLLGLLGAAAGYAYYATVGCMTGGCPLTSNPWSTTIFGAVFGVLLGLPGKPRREGDARQDPAG